MVKTAIRLKITDFRGRDVRIYQNSWRKRQFGLNSRISGVRMSEFIKTHVETGHSVQNPEFYGREHIIYLDFQENPGFLKNQRFRTTKASGSPKLFRDNWDDFTAWSACVYKKKTEKKLKFLKFWNFKIFKKFPETTIMVKYGEPWVQIDPERCFSTPLGHLTHREPHGPLKNPS